MSEQTLIRIFDYPSSCFLSPELNNSSFDDMMNSLFNLGYGQSNFLTKALNKKNFKSLELVPNYRKAQESWIKENNIKVDLTENNWKLEILEAQINYYKPTILLFVGWNYGGEYINYLKLKFNFLKKIIFWVGESLPPIQFIKPFDAILTCDKSNVLSLTKMGINCTQIHHAFEFELNNKLTLNDKLNKILFSGSLKYGSSEHSNRVKFIDGISAKESLELRGTVAYPKLYANNVKGYLTQNYHKFLALTQNFGVFNYLPRTANYLDLNVLKNEIAAFKKIEEVIKPPLYGIDYLQNMKDNLIILNAHSDTDYACNMRMFEATGVGSCLLTDYKDNIHELFEEDVEVVCYKTIEELNDKCKFLLENPKKALEIGINGQRKTQNHHTYDVRAEEYIQFFNATLYA